MDEQQIITTPAPSGFKLNIKSVAGLVVLLLLVSAIPLGVYLSQQTQIFRPKAAVTPVSGPETSLTLQAPSSVEPGKEIRVGVWARSDIDAANLFVSKLKFPTDLLQVSSINAEVGPLFVKNWIEKSFDNTAGTVSLSGGIPAPGYKTTLGQPSGLMAEVVFKTKKAGSATVTFDSESAILRNSDNTNILNIKRDASFKIETPAPSQGFGKAVKFNGSYYIAVKPLFPNVAMPSEWTLEGWVNTSQPYGGGKYIKDYTVAMLTKPQTMYDSGYIFKLGLETLEINGDSRPMFKALLANWTDVINAHLAYISIGSQNKTYLRADTWNHIAITSSASGNKCTLKMFINGVLAETAERIMNPTCQISSQQPQEIWFARPPVNSGGISGLYYPGMIDDVRLFRGLLYTNNFTPGLINPNTTDATNTIALYQFNGNVNDASTYHHNTQAVGNVQYVDSTIGIQVTPTPTGAGIKGDINGDGKVNLVDMSILLSRWGKTGTEAGKADLNADGVVNTFDYSLMLQILIQNGVIKGSQELSTELRR